MQTRWLKSMESLDYVSNLLCGSIRNLSHTFRYNTLRLLQPECVAEHSFYASIYTLALYHKLIELYPDLVDQIDLGRLLAKAICHDLEERLTGDITRCVKDILPGDVEQIASQISREGFLEEALPIDLAIYQETARTPDCLEARLINLADLLCVCAKLLEEADLGNQYASNRLQTRMLIRLEELAQLFQLEPDPISQFAYRILDNTRSVIRLRVESPPKAKVMHTGY